MSIVGVTIDLIWVVAAGGALLFVLLLVLLIAKYSSSRALKRSGNAHLPLGKVGHAAVLDQVPGILHPCRCLASLGPESCLNHPGSGPAVWFFAVCRSQHAGITARMTHYTHSSPHTRTTALMHHRTHASRHVDRHGAITLWTGGATAHRPTWGTSAAATVD